MRQRTSAQRRTTTPAPKENLLCLHKLSCHRVEQRILYQKLSSWQNPAVIHQNATNLSTRPRLKRIVPPVRNMRGTWKNRRKQIRIPSTWNPCWRIAAPRTGSVFFPCPQSEEMSLKKPRNWLFHGSFDDEQMGWTLLSPWERFECDGKQPCFFRFGPSDKKRYFWLEVIFFPQWISANRQVSRCHC